jgi:iron complex transport system ATP-binding protein
MALEVIDLSYSYSAKPVLKKINFKATPSNLTALIGPNAAGKSTLLKCVAGILCAKGQVNLDGKNISYNGDWVAKKQVGYLPQELADRNSLTVMEFVLLGRLDSLTWSVSKTDLDMAYSVMEDLDITDIATCSINKLSGGQQQICSIAQTLVRNPYLLLMDEPTNSLDLQRQLELFELIKGITKKNKTITLTVLHDLNFAARYADTVIVLKNGELYSSGAPTTVINEKMLHEVYGVNAVVKKNFEGAPEISPTSSLRCLPWFKKNTC